MNLTTQYDLSDCSVLKVNRMTISYGVSSDLDVSLMFTLLYPYFLFQAEKMLKSAYKAAEVQYKKTQQTQHQNSVQEAIHRRDTNVLVYVKRRLAMCARKLGKTREAVKMMRDVSSQLPLIVIAMGIRNWELCFSSFCSCKSIDFGHNDDMAFEL